MTQARVDACFLVVGFSTTGQDAGDDLSRAHAYMERKDIGKFSLCDCALHRGVHGQGHGEYSRLRMALPDMRTSGKTDEGTYRPEPVAADPDGSTQGTPKALRKRLARRFAVIGPQHNFRVTLNDTEISPAARDYYAKLQNPWTYGNPDKVVEQRSQLDRSPDVRPIPR